MNNIVCHRTAGFASSAAGAGTKGENDHCCKQKEDKYFFHTD